MLKLTLFDSAGTRNGTIHIVKAHVVSVMDANPRGSLVTCSRGQFHVNQSVDQILRELDND